MDTPREKNRMCVTDMKDMVRRTKKGMKMRHKDIRGIISIHPSTITIFNGINKVTSIMTLHSFMEEIRNHISFMKLINYSFCLRKCHSSIQASLYTTTYTKCL